MATCVVCLSDVDADSSVTLGCNHTFCMGCMKKCAHFNIERCPTCRRPHDLDVGALQSRMAAYRRDYRSWRTGAARGARGTIAAGVVNPITQPAAAPAAAPVAASAGDLSTPKPKAAPPKSGKKKKAKPPAPPAVSRRAAVALALCAPAVASGPGRLAGTAAAAAVRRPRGVRFTKKALTTRGGFTLTGLALAAPAVTSALCEAAPVVTNALAAPVVTNAALNGCVQLGIDARDQLAGLQTQALDTAPAWLEPCEEPGFCWRRLLVHAAYGVAFQGIAKFFWYKRALPALTGPFGACAAPVSLLVDLLCFGPLISYPAHYVALALGERKCLRQTFRRYVGEFRDVFSSSLAFWIPAQLVLFAAVPLKRRPLFNLACSILWMTVFIGRKQRVPVECSVEPEYLVAPIYLD